MKVEKEKRKQKKMVIKYVDILGNFKIKLKNNPELMPSTVKIYMKLIKQLTNNYGMDPSIEQLNEFIAIKCRKRQPVVKYAIKHYLAFRWRKNIYINLVKAKKRKSVRKKTYLSKKQAMEVLDKIKKPEHKLISKIQYFTGARASEVISIKKTNMFHETHYKRIRIDITGKGDKIEPIYLVDNIWHEIQPFFLSKSQYLFIKDDGEELDQERLRTKTETYYKRYYESLKEAVRECNLDMATHDWRRSFTQALRDGGADIFEIKKALRHESIETTQAYFQDDSETIAKITIKHQQGI